MTDARWGSATAILRLATELIDGIQDGIAAQGFDDVRPVHGFAFARLSESPATTAQLAHHLGITKQATSQLVGYLVERGYVSRSPDRNDRRASQLTLTARGRACTDAAQVAASRIVEAWEQRIPPRERAALHGLLAAVAVPGRLKPAW